MLDSRMASFTRSDESYFGRGFAASVHCVGNALAFTHSPRFIRNGSLLAISMARVENL